MTDIHDRILLEISDLRTDLVAHLDEVKRERDHAHQEIEHLIESVRRTAYDLNCQTHVDGVGGAVEALIEMAKTRGAP